MVTFKDGSFAEQPPAVDVETALSEHLDSADSWFSLIERLRVLDGLCQRERRPPDLLAVLLTTSFTLGILPLNPTALPFDLHEASPTPWATPDLYNDTPDPLITRNLSRVLAHIAAAGKNVGAAAREMARFIMNQPFDYDDEDFWCAFEPDEAGC